MNPLNSESQNHAKNISVVLPSSSIKIRGKSVKGFMDYDQKNKQTNRQVEIINFMFINADAPKAFKRRVGLGPLYWISEIYGFQR